MKMSSIHIISLKIIIFYRESVYTLIRRFPLMNPYHNYNIAYVIDSMIFDSFHAVHKKLNR